MSYLIELPVVELFWHTTESTPIIIDKDDICFAQPMVERMRSGIMQHFLKQQKEHYEETGKMFTVSDVPMDSCILHLKSCGGVGTKDKPTPRFILSITFDELKKKLGLKV